MFTKLSVDASCSGSRGARSHGHSASVLIAAVFMLVAGCGSKKTSQPTATEDAGQVTETHAPETPRQKLESRILMLTVALQKAETELTALEEGAPVSDDSLAQKRAEVAMLKSTLLKAKEKLGLVDYMEKQPKK